MLQDLALPHYHHEFVKAAVERVFDTPGKAPQLAGLLRTLSESGVITSTQMAQVRVRARIAACAARDAYVSLGRSACTHLPFFFVLRACGSAGCGGGSSAMSMLHASSSGRKGAASTSNHARSAACPAQQPSAARSSSSSRHHDHTHHPPPTTSCAPGPNDSWLPPPTRATTPPHTQGLSRVKALLADEALDAPRAPAAFATLLQQAGAEGWLPAEYDNSSST